MDSWGNNIKLKREPSRKAPTPTVDNSTTKDTKLERKPSKCKVAPKDDKNIPEKVAGDGSEESDPK